MTLTKQSLAKYFDHTFLKAYATEDDLRKLCNEAKEMNTVITCSLGILPGWC